MPVSRQASLPLVPGLLGPPGRRGVRSSSLDLSVVGGCHRVPRASSPDASADAWRVSTAEYQDGAVAAGRGGEPDLTRCISAVLPVGSVWSSLGLLEADDAEVPRTRRCKVPNWPEIGHGAKLDARGHVVADEIIETLDRNRFDRDVGDPLA